MLNKVTLIGRLGGQPETATTQGGVSITKFPLATSESYTDKQTGNRVEKTEWHRVVLFGRVAEIAAQYLNKGDLTYLEGKITTNKWQDSQTGQDRYSTEIVCNEMKMLGSPASQQGAQQGASQNQQRPQQQRQQPQQYQQPPQQQQRAPQQAQANYAPQQQANYAPQQQAGANQNGQHQQYANDGGFDDDIPF